MISTKCLSISINDDDALKYQLLSQDFTPQKNFEFPSQIESHCVRNFSADYLKNHNWLIYSKETCGAFCRYCVLFCNSMQRQM